MTLTNDRLSKDDDFGLWYRFKAVTVFNLLHLAGPAQLDTQNDPRAAVQQEYERRQDLHRARLGKPPLARKAASHGGVDPVWLCAIGAVLAVALLLVWAVVSAS